MRLQSSGDDAESRPKRRLRRHHALDEHGAHQLCMGHPNRQPVGTVRPSYGLRRHPLGHRGRPRRAGGPRCPHRPSRLPARGGALPAGGEPHADHELRGRLRLGQLTALPTQAHRLQVLGGVVPAADGALLLGDGGLRPPVRHRLRHGLLPGLDRAALLHAERAAERGPVRRLADRPGHQEMAAGPPERGELHLHRGRPPAPAGPLPPRLELPELGRHEQDPDHGGCATTPELSQLQACRAFNYRRVFS
mmetsp:Transcript_74954/g.162107  ORF Transcript_74954/g.162107 Transcript_74954/m.162107 type:complete len:249 (+) Transcript_74954:1466-2212(+)